MPPFQDAYRIVLNLYPTRNGLPPNLIGAPLRPATSTAAVATRALLGHRHSLLRCCRAYTKATADDGDDWRQNQKSVEVLCSLDELDPELLKLRTGVEFARYAARNGADVKRGKRSQISLLLPSAALPPTLAAMQ